MSKMYFLPFRPAFDSAGITVPGSQHWFTLAGTNTPSAPFIDATLVTPLENPLVSNGIGYLPPVYLDPAISYRVRVYDADAEVGIDTPLEEYDPYVPALANTDILSDLAASGGADLVGSTMGRAHSLATTALTKLSRFISASADYGILGNDSDDTTKLQNLLSDLQSGDIVVFPNGGSRLTAKLTVGNGTDSARSTINGVTFIFPPPANEVAFINPASGISKSGYYLEWYGAVGGTMMEWAGPINGIRIIGGLQLNGRDIAANGLEAYSFNNCDVDALCAYNCTTENIRLDARNATTIGGDANAIASGNNQFLRIVSFTPNNVSAIALVIDGDEVTSGQDVTGTKLGLVKLGWNGNGGKGLWLGFADFLQIDALISINYGSVSGAGSPIFLDGSSLPFEAPTTVVITWFAGTGGTVTGGTNGQVYIENYSLDDGGTIPNGITGLNIIRVHSATAANNGQTRGTFQKPVVSTISDGDGWYGKDASGTHELSLTRRGTGAHLAANGDVEFEAGATGGPTTAKQAVLSTARLTMSVPVRLATYTFATLPASPAAGDTAVISDCNTSTFNAAAAGGGANVVKVSYLGGSWKVG
jgi:hypothetical protein